MASLRKFTKRFFIFLNIVIGVLFLLACCNAFLHPDKWWFISLLAFFFPLFLVLLLVFFFIWLFVRPRYVLISLLCLLMGWKNIHAFFGFNPAKHDFSHKDSASFRILTWNVRSWDEFTTKKIGASGHRLPMLELVGNSTQMYFVFRNSLNPLIRQNQISGISKENCNFRIIIFREIIISGLANMKPGSSYFQNTRSSIHTRPFFSADTIMRTESLIAADIDVNRK